MTCSKCGSDWIVDREITHVINKTVKVQPYLDVYPNKSRYCCLYCKHEWNGKTVTLNL